MVKLNLIRPVEIFLLLLLTFPCLAAREEVLVGVDLTRGSAGKGEVSGGAWDHGWRRTGVKDERIVFDAGRLRSSGYLEVSLTI